MFLVLLSASCTIVERTHDPGRACIVGTPGDVQPFDTGGTTELDADEAATVVVVISGCASSSVDWPRKTCGVSLTGSELEISAFAKSRSPRGIHPDCRHITTQCNTPPLPAGVYTLHYGDHTESLTVPYVGPTLCLGG